MKSFDDQNRAVELVFEKKLGWFTRISSGVPCIAGILLFFGILSKALGDSTLALPAWVIPTLLFAILAWMFVPIRFQVFLHTEPSRSIWTHIRVGSLAVCQRKILCDRVELRHGPAGVVFDTVNIQVETVLCVHGENSVVICSPWVRWLFTIWDDDMGHIYKQVCDGHVPPPLICRSLIKKHANGKGVEYVTSLASYGFFVFTLLFTVASVLLLKITWPSRYGWVFVFAAVLFPVIFIVLNIIKRSIIITPGQIEVCLQFLRWKSSKIYKNITSGQLRMYKKGIRGSGEIAFGLEVCGEACGKPSFKLPVTKFRWEMNSILSLFQYILDGKTIEQFEHEMEDGIQEN